MTILTISPNFFQFLENDNTRELAKTYFKGKKVYLTTELTGKLSFWSF